MLSGQLLPVQMAAKWTFPKCLQNRSSLFAGVADTISHGSRPKCDTTPTWKNIPTGAAYFGSHANSRDISIKRKFNLLLVGPLHKPC